ncbi:MAG TPA: hydrogenase maturation protease [Terracidiphilus sp.]|jgi:hydrogenase maturation protease|nr:hydrogenase maturation protease [Terracidiphilus sp.]
MTSKSPRILILACGNTLREDDGVGPWLAEWSDERFAARAKVHVISRHQWTPELTDEIAAAWAVLFVDCAMDAEPGQIRCGPVQSDDQEPALATHHLDAGQLLRLTTELYDARPTSCLLLTVGAGSLELREGFSAAVEQALPEACRLIETTIAEWLATTEIA